MLTWLRIAVSCFCLVLCVLFVALWIESYNSYNSVYKRTLEGRPTFHIIRILEASRGQIKLNYEDRFNEHYPTKWGLDRDEAFNFGGRKRTIGFGWSMGATSKFRYRSILLPIWFPTIISGLIAYVAKPKPRWQFGSRELLTLTSAVAITAGTFAALVRSLS